MFGNTSTEITNAIELLKRDHDDVDTLFSQYEDSKETDDDDAKLTLVTQICDALTVHAQVEEEIFYPAARRAIDGDEGKDLLDEAAVEHQTLKDLIARLEAAPTDDPLYDAGVKVLSEYVKHHVKEEENELFPKVKSSQMDLEAIGRQLADRKAELTARGARQGRRSANGQHRGSRHRTICWSCCRASRSPAAVRASLSATRGRVPASSSVGRVTQPERTAGQFLLHKRDAHAHLG